VSGRASFQFNGSSFDQAFEAFLLANRLYVEKTAELWVVTRITISLAADGRIIVDALDASPGQILEKLSRRLSATIIQDILPASKLFVHLETASLYEAVQLVMKPFGEYEVEEGESYIEVRRAAREAYGPSPSMVRGIINIQETEGTYAVEIEGARLGDILDELFLRADREYTSFVRGEQPVERVKVSGRGFEETLGLILEQGNGEYRELNGLYYIFPVEQQAIITARRDEGKRWQPFELKHLGAGEVIPLVQSRFSGVQTIAQTDSAHFLAFVDERGAAELEGFIRGMDRARRAEAIRLKYIRTEDLYQALPPSVRREELIDAGNGNTFFFAGTSERLEVFRKDLAIIDRPQPRIRYDLFIMQVQETSGLNWSSGAELRELKPGDMTMVTGQLGNLLNLNFDIITVFGYQFAAKINAAIAENQATVFADTTLWESRGTGGTVSALLWL
jgi:general secretion pathway protein D/type IV pilus assembly protein PilQ